MGYGKNNETTERKYGSAPTSTKEYKIGERNYIGQPFCGEKDVDNVLREIAVKRAYSDMENKPA